MIGKKIGTYTDFFTDESPVNGYMVKVIFERGKLKGGGSVNLTSEDLEAILKIKLRYDVNSILIQYDQGKLVVNFSVYHDDGKSEIATSTTRATFAIDIDTLDVYDSQY